jgi:hypothetical protein
MEALVLHGDDLRHALAVAVGHGQLRQSGIACAGEQAVQDVARGQCSGTRAAQPHLSIQIAADAATAGERIHFGLAEDLAHGFVHAPAHAD